MAKLTADQIKVLRQLGLTYREIAEKAEVSRQRVQQIVSGRQIDPDKLRKYKREYMRRYRGATKSYKTKHNPEGK